MDALLPFLIATGTLAAVLGVFTSPAAQVRRRGLAGGAMSGAPASYTSHEEAFRIASHESYLGRWIGRLRRGR
ncbi:hypothetical protein AB0O07_14455 [Streptomyces sp. NPDC093085]|uniref:hypothetical protein n=1 Tax=Streptomyces sp. NPDC093085 TaxID=3155068 RepID=UPI0034356E78